MAVIKRGILGGFSGKIGNVVGSSWKGVDVIKSLPLSVANPQTAAQTTQRNKMTTAVRFSRILLAAIIQPFWNPFAQRQSGYNAFVSENIASLDENGIATPAAFYSQRGSLLGFDTFGGSADAGTNTISLTWVDNSGQSDALGTDEAVFSIYNETQDYWVTDVGNDVRSDAAGAITDSVMAASDVLRVYGGFARPNVSKVSDSSYIAITVA